MKKLEGRVAAITGAASGIGRATALALKQAGCIVAAADVDADGLAGLDVDSVWTVDVSDGEAVEAWAQGIVEKHGAVHIAINNAGICVAAGFEDHTLEDWERVLGVNLWGVIHGCRAFLPRLMAQDEGHLVNISSIFGIAAIPGQAAYCASKFAVRGLTEVLWEEYEGTSVGITVVHPGGIRTNIVRSARMSDPEAHQRAMDFFDKHTLPPEAVATKIIEAIRKRQPRVLVTKEAYALDLLKRVAPVAGNRIGAKQVVNTMGLGNVLEKQRAKRLGET